MDQGRRKDSTHSTATEISPCTNDNEIGCCHVKTWASILTILDAGAMMTFVTYGSYILATRQHEKFDVGPPWMALLIIAAISVIFSVVMCIGIRRRRATFFIGSMVMQAARLAIVVIIFFMYVAWTVRRRAIDSLSIPVAKRPFEFWTIVSFSIFLIFTFQIFYFRVTYKTYAFLRSGRVAILDLEKAINRDLKRGSSVRRSGRADTRANERPRISIVEEIFLRPPYLAFEIRNARRKSLLKLPEHLGLNSDKIGAFPITASHHKPPEPAQFGKWAIKRSEARNGRGGKRMSI